MKKALFVSLLLAIALALAPAAPASVGVSVTVGGFYDELSPYGHWVYTDRWGEVWYPDSVDASWQPYSNGHWVWTDYGWTWVSYDAWGGDPYHYGCWTYETSYGWLWVPGTVWAPSWVTWSYNDSYIGWAPLPPTFSLGYSGYAGSPVVLAPTSYVYVPSQQFVSTSVATVRVPMTQNASILPSSTSVTRLAVSGGVVRNTALAPAQVERISGKHIAPVPIANAKTQPVPLRSARVSGRKIPVAAPLAVRHAELGKRIQAAPASRAGTRSAPMTRSAGGPKSIATGGTGTHATHGRAAETTRSTGAPSRGTNAHSGPKAHVVEHGPPAKTHEVRRSTRAPAHTGPPVARAPQHVRSEKRAASVSKTIDRSHEPSRPARLEEPAPARPAPSGKRYEAPAPPAMKHDQPRHEPPPSARGEVAPAPRHEPPQQQAMRHEAPPPQAHAAPVHEAPVHQAPPAQAHGPAPAPQAHGAAKAPPAKGEEKDKNPH